MDDTKTNPDYAWDDVLEGVRKSCAWSGVPGAAIGSDDAKQWCIPLAYEQNNLTYNQRMFDANGLAVPTNIDELRDTAAAAKAVDDRRRRYWCAWLAQLGHDPPRLFVRLYQL